MRTAVLDPIGDPRWQAFVERADDPSIFHHAAWLELIGRRYRYEMSALCVTDDDGGIIAAIPLARVVSRLTGRRLVALPFSDRCAPLYARGAEDRVSSAVGAALAAERARTGLDVEIRARVDAVPGAHVVPRFLNHDLALGPDAEEVLGRGKGKVRRDIARARRGGVVAEAGTDRAALATFYDLHLRTRHHQGVPTQPKDFILRFEALFARGLGFVMTARHEGRPIATALYLTYGGTLTYKYGASDRGHLDLRPNHLCFAEAIRIGCEQGLRTLDFGRTDPDNAGLASFKRSWGAEERPLAYTYLADRVPGDGHGRAERLLGETIRRTPPVTGRLIGSALYRHVG